MGASPDRGLLSFLADIPDLRNRHGRQHRPSAVQGPGPEVMAAFRNAAIGFLQSTGVNNIAEAPRRNGARVDELSAKLGILKRWMVPGLDSP
jgi:hypothetical protein